MKRHWNKPSIKSITAAFSKSSKRTSQVNGSDYQYIALPSPRCIRLIELRSSKEAKQIAISLTVHDLNSAPPFDALSYTWNDPNSAYLEAPFVARHVSYGEATYDITCDNHLFRVHANLYDALRFLQDMPARVCGRSRPKYFWIDAICIDQSNLSERAEQVALMSDLYRGAKNIIAWLGPQDATTKQAFKTMEILRPLLDPNLPVSGADVARLEKAYGHIAPSDFFDTSIYNTKLGIKPITLEMWASFALLVHRPWFERVWVVQEVTLAKTISLVCGLDYIDWDDLARIIWFLLAVKWDPFVSPYTLRGHFERNSQSMFRLMGRGLEHGGQEPLQLTIVRTFTRSVGPYKLDDLLERLRFCKATNPRDKVFALRNIANPADGVLGTYGSLISPDYGIAIELLYIRVTKAIINARGDLKILNAKESDSQRELKSLPSWVPDYSVLQLPGPLTEIVHEANWNANGSYNAGPIGGDLDSPFLGVKGVRLAIVEETATEFIEPNGELLGPWLSIIELALGSEDIWQANDGLHDVELYMLFQPGQKPRAIDVHNTANQYLPSGAVLGEGERSFIRSGIGPMRLGDAVGIQDGFPVRLLPYATRVGLLMRTLICNNLNQTYPAPLEARHQFMTLPFRLMGQCDDEGAASLQDAWQRLFNDEVNSTPYNSQAVAEISELVVAEDDRLQAERSMRSSSRGKKEENATSQLLINTVTSAHSGQYNKDRSITMGARKLFRTGVIEDDPKRLGIATRDVCPGDEVWVLAGSSTLKILRSQEGDSRRKKLVGEAYMYGSMHGEVDKLGEELENIVLV